MKKTRKYKPQYAQFREWSEIENWYLELIEGGLDFEPMLKLVRYIKSSGLEKRIYAYTSMHKLVVGIYEKIEWNSEAIHIEFDISSRKWHFKYQPKPNEPIEFERKYNEEQGLNKFQNIINYLNW